jgi:hypothetical protein
MYIMCTMHAQREPEHEGMYGEDEVEQARGKVQGGTLHIHVSIYIRMHKILIVNCFVNTEAAINKARTATVGVTFVMCLQDGTYSMVPCACFCCCCCCC